MRKETHPAIVTANNDDQKRGRIRVACAELLGDLDADLPMWVEPIPDWGWFYVPDVGETVEIEVISGNAELDESFGQASIDALDVKWRGARFYGDQQGDGQQPTPVHPGFTGDTYGKRRGFATPFGHTFIFDDTDGSQTIILSWVQEAETTDAQKLTQLVFEPDGTLKATVLGKHSFHLKENEMDIRLDDGATWKVDGKDANATGVLGDGAVKVAIADHLESLYGTLKAFIEGAIVPTAMGPSGTIQAGSGSAPDWDDNINSSKLSVPDT